MTCDIAALLVRCGVSKPAVGQGTLPRKLNYRTDPEGSDLVRRVAGTANAWT